MTRALYLNSVVEAADVLSDALAADAGVALHVHEVSQGQNDLNSVSSD